MHLDVSIDPVIDDARFVRNVTVPYLCGIGTATAVVVDH